MNHDRYDDAYIRDILTSVRTIAVVGASPNPARPSFFVTKYLAERGFEVFPVNPGQAGKEIAGRPVVARLSEVPVAIDMVDVFPRLRAFARRAGRGAGARSAAQGPVDAAGRAP